MLFLLTGEVQIGKTRWLESLVTELGAFGVPCAGVLAPGQWVPSMGPRADANGFEKLGIDNVLLPGGERIPFARRGDLARADGTFNEESQAAKAELAWHIDDAAIARVNAHFDELAVASSCHPERSAEGAESKDLPTAAAPDTPLPAAVADGAATMPAGALAGRTVLVTAGPTVEPIDSVRYISNYSSGKMGYAIAEAAAAAGARVVLVSGPVALAAPAGVEVVPVKTARDMLAAAASVFPAADAAIFAAAVADLRPTNPADRKLKKGRDDAALANVPLTENPDILATLAAGKRPDQYVVGFAAETNDVLMNAHAKLQKKNADMIVANQVGDGLAFGTDNNEVWLVTEGDDVLLPLMSKRAVAERLVEVVAAHLD